jgi:hypothetical protein
MRQLRTFWKGREPRASRGQTRYPARMSGLAEMNAHAYTRRLLAHAGAVAALVGAGLLFVSTLLHPIDSDPNDAPASFAEYAASSHWVWIHIGQFVGFAGLGSSLAALAGTLEPGRTAAWARIGLAGATASIAAAAALQAVDGVALKIMADRWAAAPGDARELAYEAAFAVRQIEIGLGSVLGLLFGFTMIVFGFAIVFSSRYPTWLGGIGLLGGLGMAAAGIAQAHTGFSDLAMTLSMAAGLVLLVWFILSGILMWRLAEKLASVGDVV